MDKWVVDKGDQGGAYEGYLVRGRCRAATDTKMMEIIYESSHLETAVACTAYDKHWGTLESEQTLYQEDLGLNTRSHNSLYRGIGAH